MLFRTLRRETPAPGRGLPGVIRYMVVVEFSILRIEIRIGEVWFLSVDEMLLPAGHIVQRHFLEILVACERPRAIKYYRKQFRRLQSSRPMY